MKNDVQTNEAHVTLLAQRTTFCCGEPLTYSLLLCEHDDEIRFFIEAHYMDEVECCDVGKDICSAVTLLGLLSHACALPVTLGDIVDDFFAKNT